MGAAYHKGSVRHIPAQTGFLILFFSSGRSCEHPKNLMRKCLTVMVNNSNKGIRYPFPGQYFNSWHVSTNAPPAARPHPDNGDDLKMKWRNEMN